MLKAFVMGEWVVYQIIRLYCIKYCGTGFGIFLYLFNLNKSADFKFSRSLT